MKNNKSFEDKVFDVVFILLVIRLFYALFSATYLTTSDFFLSLFGAVFIGFLLLVFLRAFSKEFNFESNSATKNNSGSSALLEHNVFNTIEKKYRDLAQEYTNNKEHKKAAHIYMKLLKDNFAAANVLYEGEYYLEAATIQLKYLKNKPKAADCFEKGKAYHDALNLYKELNYFEKTGDMYVCLNNRVEADKAYNQAVEEHTNSKQFIKASQLLRTKLKDKKAAQKLLLEGWDKKIQANECLTTYFQHLGKEKKMEEEIQLVYNTKTDVTNKEVFFQVIKKQFGRNKETNKTIRNISYEIVSQYIDRKPDMATELNYLNTQNTIFTKDVLKYKLLQRKNTNL
ncbi:lipopolysaccharide assembly protein LapB [Flavobacterium sp. J27]|uniref:tetratricopeptide repeat protein n=1 Tax=Flavobacterium sp. J27 TaxID=2060419 RepID=UPI001030D64A|nr:hypothetical protein [Flavobacterium sp. J27]